jgi:hypothetical protein
MKPKVLVSYVFHGEVNLPSQLFKFLNYISLYPPSKSTLLVISLKKVDHHMVNKINHYLKEQNVACKYIIQKVWDKGYDIGTHLEVCRKYLPTIIVMFSAKSWPKYPNWFEKLINPFKDSSIGIVGSMFSLDSQKTSYFEVADTELRLALRLKLKKIHHQIAISRDLRVNKYELNLGKCSDKASDYIVKNVFKLYKLKRPIGARNTFSNFPNPHLRTTGMAVRSCVFLNIGLKEPTTKMETFLIESGPESLCNKVTKLGYKILVAHPIYGHSLFPSAIACNTYCTKGADSIITDVSAENYRNFSYKKQKALDYILTHNRPPNQLESN